MIKRNELDVTNIELSYRLNRGDIFLCFALFRNSNISATRYLIARGFGSKFTIFGWTSSVHKYIKIKYCRHETHSSDQVKNTHPAAFTM